MALVYPIDYLQNIIFNYLSTLPQLDSDGFIIPGTLKYPFFTLNNVAIENQEYIIPDSNQNQSPDINPFHIRILTSNTKTISRQNKFIPLLPGDVNSIEEIVRKEMVTFTFIVFSYKPNPPLLNQNNSLFLNPTSAFYKWHQANNVIYDVYNALISSYAQLQLETGNIMMENDNSGGIKNLSALEGGQIQERFQFDIETFCTFISKKLIDNYNKVNINIIRN